MGVDDRRPECVAGFLGYSLSRYGTTASSYIEPWGSIPRVPIAVVQFCFFRQKVSARFQVLYY